MHSSVPHALLQLNKVYRRRGGHDVVQGVSLSLQAGEVLGLLGVNGAGKSTTLMMMAGALAADRGQITVQGRNLAEVPGQPRQTLGYLPEHAPLWNELSVTEQLHASGQLRGLNLRRRTQRSRQLLDTLHLNDVETRLCGQLSLGQRQRVGLACALLHEPPLLILDEPSNGLDPLQAEMLRNLLRERAAAGVGIVLSTHLLSEVTAVCTRVAILHEGRLQHDAAVAATPQALRIGFAIPVDVTYLKTLQGVREAEAEDPLQVRIVLEDPTQVAALTRALVAAGLPPVRIEPASPPLARLFLDIASRRAVA